MDWRAFTGRRFFRTWQALLRWEDRVARKKRALLQAGFCLGERSSESIKNGGRIRRVAIGALRVAGFHRFAQRNSAACAHRRICTPANGNSCRLYCNIHKQARALARYFPLCARQCCWAARKCPRPYRWAVAAIDLCLCASADDLHATRLPFRRRETHGKGNHGYCGDQHTNTQHRWPTLPARCGFPPENPCAHRAVDLPCAFAPAHTSDPTR